MVHRAGAAPLLGVYPTAVEEQAVADRARVLGDIQHGLSILDGLARPGVAFMHLSKSPHNNGWCPTHGSNALMGAFVAPVEVSKMAAPEKTLNRVGIFVRALS